MVTRHRLRSKTFNIVKEKEWKRAQRFLKSFPKDSNVWMETYGVGKGRRIPRAVVYYE